MKNNIISVTTNKLLEKLREIYDDDEFVMGVLTYADNEEDQQTIIQFIEKGEDVDDETVTVLAMELSDMRA